MIYESRSYREALAAKIQGWKEQVPDRTLTALANTCSMQPSYLSTALKLRVHLSSDQVYTVAKAIGCRPPEIDYLLLLLEFERSSIPERREYLEERIREIQAEQLSTRKHLEAKPLTLSSEDLNNYYLNPFTQLVHLYIAMRPGTTAVKLSDEFHLANAQTAQILEFLLSTDLIQQKGSGFVGETPATHLSKDSALSLPYLLLVRVKALDQLQRLSSSQRYSFSVTMSTNHEVRLQLEREFSKFLKAAEKLVRGSNPDGLYQLNFDLFPWLTRGAREREK